LSVRDLFRKTGLHPRFRGRHVFRRSCSKTASPAKMQYSVRGESCF
jgi:hypothetical protein